MGIFSNMHIFSKFKKKLHVAHNTSFVRTEKNHETMSNHNIILEIYNIPESNFADVFRIYYVKMGLI